jgi:hypothetical protein
VWRPEGRPLSVPRSRLSASLRALDLDVWDYDMVEAMLDEAHCLAYPDTTTRPARICIEPAESPLEDY